MAPLSFIDSPFTTRVAYNDWLALPEDKRAAALANAAAPAAPAALAKAGGLLAESDFFKREGGAPLLRRNNGYLKPDGLPEGLRERLDAWPSMCGVSRREAVDGTQCEDEAALRIFLRDAERTFQDEGHRNRMMELLRAVWPENKDYHQGLGYVTSLLMLFFDGETVVSMLLRLTRDDKYTPGYWKAAPEAYVRDAMVYQRLLEQRVPKAAALLQQACVVPEAYASKWFIGLCVHVLPFEALLSFVEAFLEEGFVYLFKFSVACVQAVEPRLLECKFTDVNIILELLRLDTTQYPDDYGGDGSFFTKLVADAKAVDLEPAQLASLRAEAWDVLQEKMRRTREREAQMAAEDSDDEIVFSDEED